MKHTNGPWWIERKASSRKFNPDARHRGNPKQFTIRSGENIGVAICFNSEANAKLIAASPDMFSLLKDFLDDTTEWTPDYLQAFAEFARVQIERIT